VTETVPFPSWESFYVIVGSSAGALTGLQFVVMALIAEQPRRATSSDLIGAFGTPTIVHFCVVLVLSAMLSAPWPSLTGPSWILSIAGALGLAYCIMITAKARQQKGYKPVFEDWLFHSILPLISYTLLLVSGLLMTSRTTLALFMIGTMAITLLLVGIHNAWDTVTFIVVGGGASANRASPSAEAERDPTGSGEPA
jgi:hypothetical protein